MAKRDSGQTEEEKKHARNLHRREKRLLNRLDEAQERYETAQKRLKQAEEKVQKRKGSVERLEGRLLFVRQQLAGNKGVLEEGVKPILEETEEIDPPEKAEGKEESTEETALKDEGEVYSESEAVVAVPILPEEELEKEEEQEESPLVEEEREREGEQVHEDVPVEQEEATEPEEEEPAAEPVLEEIEPEEVTELEEEEPVAEPVLEEEIELEEEEPEEEEPEEEEEAVPVLDEEEAVEEPVAGPVFTDEMIKVLNEARKLAETAERAARVAIARTDHLFEHLEQMANGRYLQQEVEQLQGESESLSALARRARKIVEAVIVLSTKTEIGEELAFLVREIEEQRQILGQIRMSFEIDFAEEPVEEVAEEESKLCVTAESALDMSVDEVVFDLPQSVFNHQVGGGEPEVAERAMPPFPLDVIEEAVNTQIRESGQIEQLNEEEKDVETVAAMLIANAAAAAAAEAEALAEASGQHTRDAYTAAIQADQLVKQIRAAIQLGTLNGEEAETVLRQVERAATDAQAALADAEAAEEQAVSAAINAEAEAEVAEGMALSSQEREEDLEEEEGRILPIDEPLPGNDLALKRARVEADEAEIQESASSRQELV